MAESTNNKVRFGLCGVHIAKKTGDGAYDTPVAIPGAVSLSTKPEGDSEKFFADNGAYFTVVTDNGYTGDLEMALIPDSVKVDIFNWEIDKNGALVEIAGVQPNPFALLFTVDGDAKQRRSVFYNCTAERPETEDKTTEDKASPTTEKMPIVMIPEAIGGKKVTKLSIEPSTENQAVYDAFFADVLLPKFTDSEPSA
ncbi:major tail protein [Raoultibacter timonensis]|uniref:Phage tail protein n=1 Tax=Raoultibacter timonensis TaxID=1907662 RepID=A0ABM7WFL0_9ACTN|nr:major tail protein [Raoultibacter timonensis]BDE94951.1 hypothetical protein CE91St30_02840 [Raoultibacter timonensis]BDF49554.1 hypothetical protein CE91St31_02840 [Raoultibacter timonensis]